MRRYAGKEIAEIKNLDGGLFLALIAVGGSEAVYFSSWEWPAAGASQLPEGKFDCKAVGPAAAEAKARELAKARGWNFVKFVERSSGSLRFEAERGRLQVEKRVRVAILDDSKTIRQLLRKVLSSDSSFEVVADFEDPAVALAEIPKLRIDVVTSDIHMPGIDGVEFVKRLLPGTPLPVVMISAISMQEGPLVLAALEAGAVDYIQKPTVDRLHEVGPQVVEKVKAAAGARILSRSSAPVVAAKPQWSLAKVDRDRPVVIGSSTGGTEALRDILVQLPAEIPPILIVQHIPAVFSKAFAERLSGLCRFPVHEAADGQCVEPGHCYIAPGGKQMALRRAANGAVHLRITDDEPVKRHKPSVDYLFRSVAEVYGHNAIGVILTGMGSDGADGLKLLHDAGCATLGQNESSCVVYGMPQAAKRLGAVDKELHLREIPGALGELLTTPRRKKSA